MNTGDGKKKRHGRPRQIIDLAYTVTEMRMVKNAFKAIPVRHRMEDWLRSHAG